MPQGIEILGLTADSRAVGPGFLFAALPGAKADGRQFIDDAVARGAVAILAPESARQDGLVTPVPVIYDVDPRRRLALMAAHFYRAQPRHVAAVTGTNGKTSVAWFTRQIWEAFGHRAASMGTLGLRAEGFEAGPSLTTPDPVALHRDLARLAASGIDRLAIEASSHGLVQCRLDGVVIAAAAFTNLTRDHLDYHGTMEAYRAAKLRLFDTLLPRGAAAVLNADSPEYGLFAETARNRGSPVIAYGAAGIELRIDASRPTATGQEIAATVFGRRHHVSLPLPGAFQAANAFCALGLAVATGEDPDAAVARLAELAPVPGRLQLAARKANGAAIYVDYAHTPDALETVIAALRPHAAGRLVVVFGCGGDRDPGKRPMMGAIAARLADRAIVTNDNPRSEDPASIRRAILAAAPGAAEIGDRGRAIRTAADALGPGDILLIAGKGHETGQIVGTEVRPFDDVIAAREAVGGGGAS
ncbi:MAG: UDP-N-acetylmuramoyl-L-alanyl-D-glutamate--2,6-diaminopimelate ligase [Alphaproteobacteria bacterium]|nr:UDP-N-acetylmuramoyl-L-alanyl-D-glutamate--2,6-diaminopimelate ligase [Alphaproteobacteria bacterium]